MVAKHETFVDLSAGLLTSGYGVRFRAKGSSMLPTIQEGEMMTVVPVAPHEVSCGDIILYCFAGGMIAHRVVRMAQAADGGAVFSVRGDASWAFDQAVEAQQVLGRVVSVERGSRQVELTTQRAKFLHCVVAGLFRLKRWLHSRVAIPRNERVL